MAITGKGAEAYKLEIQGLSIVALGSFNPAIFHPIWFSNHNLIREQEAEKAKIEIMNQEVAIISTDWFDLQVTKDRFSVETVDPTKDRPIRDLVFGTFGILEHTPINMFGLNSNQHFKISSEDEWHGIGHFYAPKKSWHEIVAEPGLRILLMEGKRENCSANKIRVRMEPSAKVSPGVFIHVNEHYQISDKQNADPKDYMKIFLQTLQDSWDDFLSYRGKVPQHLFSEYEKGKE